MTTLAFRFLPLVIQLAYCTNGDNCFLKFMEDSREQDFKYTYRIEKTVDDLKQAEDTIAIFKKGERIAWVSSDVISVKNERWSYAAYVKQGISVTNVNEGRSSYFFAPQDFISVLEFASDSAQTILCHPSQDGVSVTVDISLKNNALFMKEVSLQFAPDGSPTSMAVVYSDSSSTISMRYVIIHQDGSKNRARPYLDMLEERDGDLIPKGELAGYRSVTRNRIE